MVGLRAAFVNPPVLSGDRVIRAGRCQVRCQPGIGLWPPISLAGAAAAVRTVPGSRVWLADGALARDPADVVAATVEFAPDLLVVEGTTPTLADDIEFVRAVKMRSKRLLAVMYGLHATARPRDVLAGGVVDGAVIGEPELTLIDLARAMAGGSSVAEIDGLMTAGADRVQGRVPPELDALPLPARDLLDNGRYRLAVNGQPFTIIQVSRGCRYRCVFCTARLYSGSPRFRSAGSIAGEVEQVRGRYGIRDFMFLSDTFTADCDRVRQLCTELIERRTGIRWVANSRTDTIDPETARLMRQAGCWLVSLGIESGSDAVLRAAGKGTTTAQARSAVNVFRAAGIKTIGYFMFGLPGETRDTIQQTIDLALGLPLSYAYFYTATPFPGTPLFAEAQRRGRLLSEDWSRYFHGESDVLAGDGLTPDDLASAVRRAYRAFYLRPGRMLGHLLAVRSPSALASHVAALSSVLGRVMQRSSGEGARK